MRSLPICAVAVILLSGATALAEGIPGSQISAPEKLNTAKPDPETTPPDIIAPSSGTGSETQASVPIGTPVAASSTAINSGIDVGMDVKRSTGGQAIGKIVDVARDNTGLVTGAVVETIEGARRIMPRSDLRLQGGAAITSRTLGEIMAMPRAQ